MNLGALNRSGVWTVLLGSVIIFGDAVAEVLQDPWRGAIKAALTFAATSLGLAINTRKGLAPTEAVTPPKT